MLEFDMVASFTHHRSRGFQASVKGRARSSLYPYVQKAKPIADSARQAVYSREWPAEILPYIGLDLRCGLDGSICRGFLPERGRESHGRRSDHVRSPETRM